MATGNRTLSPKPCWVKTDLTVTVGVQQGMFLHVLDCHMEETWTAGAVNNVTVIGAGSQKGRTCPGGVVSYQLPGWTSPGLPVASLRRDLLVRREYESPSGSGSRSWVFLEFLGLVGCYR